MDLSRKHGFDESISCAIAAVVAFAGVGLKRTRLPTVGVAIDDVPFLSLLLPFACGHSQP